MDIKKITRDYILHGKTFEQIGNEHGVTRQAVHAFYHRNKNKVAELLPTFDCSSNFVSQMKFKRKQLGITQEELAIKLGTYKSNISLIEKGLYQKSKYIPKICVELNISC